MSPHKHAFMLCTTTAHPVRFGMSRVKSANPKHKPNKATATNVLIMPVGTRVHADFLYVQRLPQKTRRPMKIPQGAANQECTPKTFRVRNDPSNPHRSPDNVDVTAALIF